MIAHGKLWFFEECPVCRSQLKGRLQKFEMRDRVKLYTNRDVNVAYFKCKECDSSFRIFRHENAEIGDEDPEKYKIEVVEIGCNIVKPQCLECGLLVGQDERVEDWFDVSVLYEQIKERQSDKGNQTFQYTCKSCNASFDLKDLGTFLGTKIGYPNAIVDISTGMLHLGEVTA